MTEAQQNNTQEKTKKTSTKSGEWFRFDVDFENDPKIIALLMEHGSWGLGLYLRLVAVLYKNDGVINLSDSRRMKALVYQLRDKRIPKFISSLIDLGLFSTFAGANGEEMVRSGRVDRELDLRNGLSARGRDAVSRRKDRQPDLLTYNKPSTNLLPLQDSTEQNKTVQTKQIETREVVCDIAPPPLVLEKPKKIEKPLVAQFTHVRMTPEEVLKVKAQHPDKAMREFYYKAVDDWLDANPKKRSRDCYRTVLAWIRRDRIEQRGWFTPKKTGGFQSQPVREPPRNRADCRPASEVLKAQGIDLSALVKGVNHG